jgi:hypothetical protein
LSSDSFAVIVAVANESLGFAGGSSSSHEVNTNAKEPRVRADKKRILYFLMTVCLNILNLTISDD